MDFKKMIKRKQKAGSSVDALKQRLAKKSYDDDRLWKYELDKSDQASAVLRFLPASQADMDYAIAKNPDIDEESIPFWLDMHEHSFKHNGKWYINVCPTTFGDSDCPVCNYNSAEIEATGLSFDDIPKEHPTKIGVRNRKRKQWYYANVLVVKDPANPSNVGKVMIFKFGWSIYNQINDKLFPKFADEESVNVADWLEGCNYELKVYKKNGQVTYDKCDFAKQSPVSEDVNEMERIFKEEHTLHPFVDETIRKDVGDLSKQLNRVLGIKTAPVIDAPKKDAEIDPNASTPEPEAPAPMNDDDDDALFESMMNAG